MMTVTSPPSGPSLPTSGAAAVRRKLRTGAALLLLAGACSRAPAPDSTIPASATSSSPDTGAAHLAWGEEAQEREQFDLAGQEAEKARALFGKDGDVEGGVRAGILVAAVASRRGDYKVALDQLNTLLARAQEKLGPAHPEVAHAYYEIGTVYVSTGRPKEGLGFLEKALALRRAPGGAPTKEVAEVLVRMGSALAELGEDERALALFDEAEAASRNLPGQPQLASALVGKGASLWGLARYDPAIEALEEAVRILENEKSRRGGSLAAAYVNLGNVYWSKSDYDEALVYYEKALPLQIAARGEAHEYVGLIHFNIATLHFMKHEYDACIASAEGALKILVPALGERHSLVAQTYNVMGVALTKTGEANRALGVLEKALALQLSLPEKGDRDSAVIYSSLADAYRARHDFVGADRDFRKALAIDLSIHGERHPDVAEDLVNLGDLHLEKEDPVSALRFYGKAIAADSPQPVAAEPDLDPPFDAAFSEDFLLKALKGAARARALLAAKKTDRDSLEAAALVYDHAAHLVDRMRAGYRAEGSKLWIAESAAEIYDEAIRTELELQRLTGDARHLESAFRFAERSKVGVLRDTLNEAKARSFAGIPGELVERERRLRADLAAADQRLTEAALEKDVQEDRLRPLRDEQFARKREYDALQQRLQKEYPTYYDLKYRFDTAGPAEIRERALGDGTVLVEYFVGREHVFIFTLTAEDLAVASAAREASLEADLADLRRAIVERNDAAYRPLARRLYGQLLAPVEDRIAGRDLLIVPDGALTTVPFEALLEREVGSGTTRGEWPSVLGDHAVTYAYSATVALQSMRRGRAEPPDDFVGLAPDFATASDAGGPAPLPASRKEVTDARELFARRRGFFADWLNPRSRAYLGPAATEDRLKSADLERYRYVHLATHGIVDEEHPALSKLLLAPQAASAEDGILHLGESYGLHLNADLVVLSACDTGRGRLARGEGIIGFTHGFLYAGAESLLVSLWPVSDTASSELVVDFYRELVGGRPRAQALRQAKLRTMARNPEYAKPYYWSSLVLLGSRR
jgi:CHAT domain-containing protein/lipopolysaccharide biosynthesis regulator YciM